MSMSGELTVVDRSGDREAAPEHEKIAAMTRQLFGGQVTINSERDPETNDEYFVVYAEAQGEVDELAELDHQWHRRIGELAGNSVKPFCLSLVLL